MQQAYPLPFLVQSEQSTLGSAIERLYTTFADYPLRDVMKGCLHCLESIDSERLHATPLRQLTEEDLDIFLHNNVALTVGDALDLKYFLPRICEIMAWHEGNPSIFFSPESLGSTLSLHGYETWPQAEQKALQGFFLAWWRAMLATIPLLPFQREERVETLLCAVSQFSQNLSPYLAAWRSMSSGTALLHLIVFIRYFLVDSKGIQRRNLLWSRREDHWQQLVTWAGDLSTATRLRKIQTRFIAAKEWDPDLAPSRLMIEVMDWLDNQAADK